MFNRLVIALIAGVALGHATPVRAQIPRHDADSILRQIRVLDSAMLARGRVVDSIRRVVVRPVPPVEVVRGTLRVRTDSALAPRVSQALDTVARLIERRGGSVFSARASAFVPTVARDSTRSILGMLPVIAIEADTARRWSTIGERRVHAPATVDELADALASLVEQFATRGSDSALSAWVMVGRAPLSLAGRSELADTYIELATTESIALRRCRARDVSACLDALGVDSMPGTRLTRWYTPEDYRSMVRVTAPPRQDSAAVAAWLRCRERGDDDGCRVAARALTNERIPLPLSGTARLTFLSAVLDAGGPGSFDRLLSTSGSMKNRLTTTANGRLDDVVLRWLDTVESSRPDRMRLRPSLVFASLGWTCVVVALALTRRTSWA
jgi:hypothetical protein